MTPVNAKELRDAFGAFITGVTVVTALGEDGSPVGFTANSFTSVSLDPPLLLVCPAKSLTSFPVFNTCTHFVVNILSENQQDISNIFATSKDDRFGQVSWRRDEWQCPVIEDVAASFCCSAHDRFDAGDHIILMGQINTFHCSGDIGLGYSKDGYFSLGLERKSVVPARPDRMSYAGAIVEYGGKVLVEETPTGLRLPCALVQDGQGVFATITGLMDTAGLVVDFGPVYSIFEDKAAHKRFAYYRCVARDGNPGVLGTFVALEELVSRQFETPTLSTMMQRYFLEQKSGVFGVYVGDDANGDVHMFGEDTGQ